MSNHIISQQGYEKLKQELNDLIIKRKEIARRIKKAKEHGDLSENAEYHEAKDAQAFNEGKIFEINAMLRNAIIAQNKKSTNRVILGSKIIVKVNNIQKEYILVSFNEADPLENKISNESPLGQALFGKKIGDIAVVDAPKGKVKYEIIKIMNN